MSGDGTGGGRGMPRLMQIVVALVLGLIAMAVFAVRGCEEGPFGRKRVVALSPEQEVELGLQAYREVLRTSDVIRGKQIVDVVETVTSRLTKATQNPRFLERVKIKPRDYNWEVKVVESDEVNAFCLPGGKMVVFTGILPVCQSNAGLATVMGHEIAHALGRHGAERMANEQMLQIGVTAAGAGLGDMDPGQRKQILSILNAGAKFGILKYSREHETEADHIGLLLMATAGYDPSESVEFWTRMQARSRGRSQPEFLSTHPGHDRRIADLRGWLKEAMPLYDESRKIPTRRLPN